VKPLISMLVRVVAVAGVAGLSMSAALAFDGPMHGAVLAGINDHGNLVLVLDRYQGPGDAENGEADAVIMFAAADDAPLPEIVQAIRQSESRINLDMRRDSEGAFLHLNIPRSADYILKVDYGLTAPNDRSGSMHHPVRPRATTIAGLALSIVHTGPMGWTLREALDHYQSFELVEQPPG
jgi:hypothetical protein